MGARMKPGQRHILYITGRNKRDASKSPYIEGLRKEGYEIIYMIDPVDEYAVQFLKEYKDKELLSCMTMQAARLLDHRTQDDLKAEMEPVRKRIKSALASKVHDVCFASDISAELCARTQQSNGDAVLELNFRHDLIKELSKRAGSDSEMKAVAEFLLEIGRIHETDPDDPLRDDAAEQARTLMRMLDAGERDSCGEDLPVLRAASPFAPVDLLGEKKGSDKDQSTHLSCGSVVRIIKDSRARRAIISFVDEDEGTVDVMYPRLGGGEEEEEGLKNKLVHKLLDFELHGGAASTSNAPAFKDNFYQTALAVKAEGNQLFKLKDFEAAHDRYSIAIDAFCKRPLKAGQKVLLVRDEAEKRQLVFSSVASIDAEGHCELRDGTEVEAARLMPVLEELLPLQSSLHMNRARCRQNLGMHLEAAQDLTCVLSLWACADRRMLKSDAEMKEAEAKDTYTAEYLRGRSRLALGWVKQAALDVKEGLARNPPPAVVKQLRELKVQVQAAQEKYREVNGPLVKELAKLAIFLRGGPKVS